MNIVLHTRTKKQVAQFVEHPSHAIALEGELGAGKGYLAQYLSASLLDSEKNPMCLTIDIAASKAGIDEIRTAQKFLTLIVPGKRTIRRTLILEHIDALGHEAQNALLKTLEEPPYDTVIIVTYSREKNVLPTIHSRVQHIQVLPITMTQAEDHFKQPTTKEFLISGGNMGLMTSLIESGDHPLLVAISEARQVLQASRYQRLAMIDKLIKNTETKPALLLDALYRLINASYQQAITKKSNEQLKSTANKLRHIDSAIADIDANVQAKLVYDRLFLEL